MIITINHRGTDRHFEARWEHTTYVKRLVVSVNGTDLRFEPDEEGHIRVLTPADFKDKNNAEIDISLLKALTASVEAIWE